MLFTKSENVLKAKFPIVWGSYLQLEKCRFLGADGRLKQHYYHKRQPEIFPVRLLTLLQDVEFAAVGGFSSAKLE